jgi:hypothetical protein
MPVERLWAMTKNYLENWCQYDLKLLMVTGGLIDCAVTAVARVKDHHVRRVY